MSYRTCTLLIGLFFFAPLFGQPLKKRTAFIEQIILNSHNCMDMDEFSYLTDLAVGQPFDPNSLNQAKEILEIKKRFKKIALEWQINPTTKNIIISCSLDPTIIIKNIKIKGSVHSKATYEHLYQQQPGASFSQALHQKSLKAIKERLIYDGYLRGSVISTLHIDSKTKTVSVQLTLDTGPRFFITNINLVLNSATKNTNSAATTKTITSCLNGIFNPFIKRYQYNQERIKKWGILIKKRICELGFLKPKLRIKIKINNATNEVCVFFIITTANPCYVFEGNVHATKQELLNSLNAHAIANKPLQTSVIKHQVRMLYQTKGYWEPQITVAPSQELCTIHINEGMPLVIKQITVETHKKTPPPFPWTQLTKVPNKTRCTRQFIKQHLQKIIQAAIKHGFWDCKITSTRLTVTHTTPNECILKITVTPGLQRILGEIQINKPETAVAHYSLQALEALQNKPFDPQILTETRKKLLGTLYQQGYWYSSVDYVLKADDKNVSEQTNNVSLRCTIDPGEQVVFGKLITQGYTKLPFKKILKNCNFPEKTVWDQKKIDSSRSRLHHLEIFDHVKFSSYQRTIPKGYKHIIANILDDAPYEARIKLGFFASNDKPFLKGSHTMKLAGSYRVKNPLNKADMFIIGAQADSTEQQINVQYSIPELLGSNQINSFCLATENRRYMLNLTEPLETVVERRTGFSISALPATILNESQFGWSAGIDSSKLLGYHGNMNIDPILLEKSLFFVYIEPTFKRISLDEKKSMAEGFSTEATARFLFPFVSYGNAPVLRFCFKQRFSKNIHNLFGFLLTFRFGHIFSDNAFSGIHPNDRFYLGGADTIRGYSKDTLPPLGSYTTSDGKTGYTVQGGKTLLQINVEFRHRVAKNTELQFFHDLGSLGQDSPQEMLSHMYRTIGAGTRIYTPVGIVKFDIGYKLSSSYPDEHSYNWHLSFDGSF